MPPPKEPPLRDGPELVDRPNPPERGGGLLALALLGGELTNERWERVGFARVRARAATFSAFGETGWPIIGCRPKLEPAVRELMLPRYRVSSWRFQPPP